MGREFVVALVCGLARAAQKNANITFGRAEQSIFQWTSSVQAHLIILKIMLKTPKIENNTAKFLNLLQPHCIEAHTYSVASTKRN